MLAALVVFLAAAGAVVWSAHERPVAADPAPSVVIDPVADDSEPGEGEDAWRRHRWQPEAETIAPVPPEEGPSPGDPHDRDAVYDPQTRAMQRAFGVEGDAGVPLPFEPTEHPAVLVSSEGAKPSDRAAGCDVRVLPVRTREFNCVVRVMCGGEVLYPNESQTAGYVPCELDGRRVLRATDEGTTGEDGDPALWLDLVRGTVRVEDRGEGVSPYRATLRIR